MFKKLITLSVILILACNSAIAQGGFQTKTLTFKTVAFDNLLQSQVGPKVMGYQYVLLKDGEVVTEKAGGQARTGSDGSMTMKNSTPLNIGSLAKFLSGTAFMNMMEKPASTTDSLYKEKNLAGRLDVPIWGEFPEVWLNVIPPPNAPAPQIRSITFRKLLQHRAGFNDGKTPQESRTVLGFLGDPDGFIPSQFGKYQYSNINFLLTGYLLPLIERHNLNHDLNLETSNKSQAAADKYVRDKLGARMDAIMRERIWNKMSPKINPSCDGPKELKDTLAYGYINKQAKGGGVAKSMIAEEGHCVGSGGYFMSSRDFANYVSHFSASDLIVSKEGRDLMYKEGMNVTDRLVWSLPTSDSWIEKNFKVSWFPWSNGASGGNRTVLIRFPLNYYLILFTNSADLKVDELLAAGIAAFKEGMKDNFE